MEGNYPVFFGKDSVGSVSVHRLGLYYQFDCSCRLSGDVMCRLQVRCGDKAENLGIVVPGRDGFGLRTRLPVKKLGAGEPRFVLIPKYGEEKGKFVPICPDEPFAYIAKLKDAYLARKDGQAGIYL